MPKFAIVVNDPDKHRAFELKRYTEAFQRSGVSSVKAKREAESRAPTKRERGFVHVEMSDDCPDGLPNCRNCGDPAHAASCRASGHCQDCGTKHGIAPDAVLAAHGFALEPR